MVETALSLVCLIVLLLTRSRLERAERRLREMDVALTKLQGDLTEQAKRLAHSEAQLAQRPGEPVASPTSAQALGTSAASAPLSPGVGVPLAAATQEAPPLAATGVDAPPLAAAGVGAPPLAATGVGAPPLAVAGVGATPLAAAGAGAPPLAATDVGEPPLAAAGVGAMRASEAGVGESLSAAAVGAPPLAATGVGAASVSGTGDGLPHTAALGGGTPSIAASVHGVQPTAAAAGDGTAPVSAGSPPGGQDPLSWAFNAGRELLFGGNTVVRVGIVVLLVGVTLLLRWATEHSLFPIELRLAAVAVGAMALVGFGFSQRQARRGFALTLQGGGIAALYLVVFFAFRSYGLLPAPLAFALLCTISVCSGVLSVQQDSRALIFIAQLFGFAAPILASTGEGSHVALFSYYLLLNALTFAVALYKAWRAVNLLGFAFTFGVAAGWGVLRYEPGLFASTEPFLLAFFAVYVAIPVLFALRHPGTPHGWVDGSLVFGTPLAALGLQWALVHDRPFGMAFSALGLAAVYLGLAVWLRRIAPDRLRALAEAFVPIGVGFTTLAIPYAVDDHNLTGAAWAIEGAGLYWVGVRQERRLSRAAGVLLQLLAGGARLPDTASGHLSSVLSGILIGLSALFIAYYAYARRSQLHALESRSLQLLIVWGLPFVLFAALQEVARITSAELRPGAELATCAALALLLETAARRGDWFPGRLPPLLLWPLMAAMLLRYIFDWDEPPYTHGGLFSWPVVALAMYFVLRRFVDSYKSTHPAQLRAHATALWLWAAWLMALCRALTLPPLQLDTSYGAGAATLVLALLGLAVVLQTQRGDWPAGEHPEHYLRVGMAGLMLAFALWAAGTNLGLAANVEPLPYLPLLNPIELPTLIGALVAFTWRKRLRELAPALATRRSLIALCVLLFCFWNTLLARAVHHYAGVPFDWNQLLRSSALQLAFSLSWTAIALAVMWTAHRRAARTAWITAAVLLGTVVCKLFVVDLDRLSAPAKIASFMGVGALLLIIGYIAPVPPRAQTAPKQMEMQP